MMAQRGNARPVLMSALLLVMATAAASQQQKSACGKAGQACCCSALDWQNPRCCSDGLACAMFAGEGFGTPPTATAMCLPASKGCGGEGAACCVAPNQSGYVSGSCRSGLQCIPAGASRYGSKSMYDKLAGGPAAASSAALVGTCRKDAGCGRAYSPCGAGAGCGDASCPAGFYCASAFDSGTGDRCIPLPANAGKAGGPCMPNNLAGAPVVSSRVLGKQVAAPFCPGSAVCFTPVGGDTTGFTFDRSAGDARKLATRISGTRCVEVPADCGKGVGKPCCYSDHNAVTDKPLASGGDVCGSGTLFCEGSYSPFADQPLGKCVANVACGGPKQPCCRYSNAEMAGVSCPRLGKPGAGYCNLAGVCSLCPKVAYSVEDLLRCT